MAFDDSAADRDLLIGGLPTFDAVKSMARPRLIPYLSMFPGFPPAVAEVIMSTIISKLSRNAIHRMHRSGRIGGYALAWLIGVPVPILLIIFLLRGCS